ncbi:DUF3050 domain-containing protein [Edaphobacter sp. HDX4]|uniref:DUF3050 domain-containing protein n=1 Tax=Edaphobacter sp. HDX4 TaxID=2794064 RepID=UPI002FE53BB7
MQTTETSLSVAAIQIRIAPLQQRLQTHPLYASIRTLPQIRLFMQSHVFAVWDFMSLLKSLQRTLTSVDVPWVPTSFPESRRFINEIVLGEETDQYQGRTISHFELYLDAMEQARADTGAIRRVVDLARTGALSLEAAPPAAREFVESTFRIIGTGSPAAQAAAFAFGREDAIPEMFRAFVRHFSSELGGELDLLVWYLERHIEVDGDDHGPLALSMVSDLCGDNPDLWAEATQAAEDAIHARIRLWDGVLTEITNAPPPHPVSS